MSRQVTGQLWSLATTTIELRLKLQLNSTLFAKTLVRKDLASSTTSAPSDKKLSEIGAEAGNTTGATEAKEMETPPEDDFQTKNSVFSLMTIDVDRVAEFAFHMFALIDSPVELVIGTVFLYHLLGKFF